MSEQPALNLPGVNTEPDWKHHEIEITGHGDGCVSSEFICNAPLGSFCHAKFDCDCGEYYDFAFFDAGVPFHYTWEGERHEGTLDKDFCNYRRHYEFHSNLFTGSIRVPVEMTWEGAGYSFKLKPEEAEGKRE